MNFVQEQLIELAKIHNITASLVNFITYEFLWLKLIQIKLSSKVQKVILLSEVRHVRLKSNQAYDLKTFFREKENRRRTRKSR